MQMSESVNTGPADHRPRWKSVAQLSDIWGLSRARTRLIVRSLVRSGRMEARPLKSKESAEYRVLSR